MVNESKISIDFDELQTAIVNGDYELETVKISTKIVETLFPPMGIIDGFLEIELVKSQKEKIHKFLMIILADPHTITTDQVDRVTCISELARTIEVIKRLAKNDKIKYIANLFKNTFFTKNTIVDVDEYEEMLRNLDDLSYREITLLGLLVQCEKDFNPNHNRSSLELPRKVFERFIVIAQEKMQLDKNKTISIVSGMTRTGFCREITGSYSTYGDLSYVGGIFYPTKLVDELIEKIM